MPARKTDPIEHRKRALFKKATTRASTKTSLTGKDNKLAPVTLAKLKFMEDDEDDDHSD